MGTFLWWWKRLVGWTGEEDIFPPSCPGLDAHRQGGPKSGGPARTGPGAQSWSHQTSCPQSSLAVVPATFFLFVWTSVGLGYKFVAGRGGVDGANSHLLVGSGTDSERQSGGAGSSGLSVCCLSTLVTVWLAGS